MRDTNTTGTFSLTGVPGTNVTVLGEARQIAISSSNFRDSFAGYGVHLYQIVWPVTNVPASPPSLSRVIVTNNQLQFLLTGTAGSNYVVEASTNLLAPGWISLRYEPRVVSVH